MKGARRAAQAARQTTARKAGADPKALTAWIQTASRPQRPPQGAHHSPAACAFSAFPRGLVSCCPVQLISTTDASCSRTIAPQGQDQRHCRTASLPGECIPRYQDASRQNVGRYMSQHPKRPADHGRSHHARSGEGPAGPVPGNSCQPSRLAVPSLSDRTLGQHTRQPHANPSSR